MFLKTGGLILMNFHSANSLMIKKLWIDVEKSLFLLIVSDFQQFNALFFLQLPILSVSCYSGYVSNLCCNNDRKLKYQYFSLNYENLNNFRMEKVFRRAGWVWAVDFHIRNIEK